MTDVFEYALETLREGDDLVLYRGWKTGNASPVLVVAPASTTPTLATLERLGNEYAFASELDPAWAARPLALVRHEQRTMLVLEDPGGEPIDRALGHSANLTVVLRAAIALADAVGQVHQRGLIHKDIKPANVFLDASGRVRLTGFGIASRLARERQDVRPPEVIAGTLAYMAPEQTGRMNRSIDSRTDLYALGITLYELLTGTLPFAADGPLEWVHCHIARQPTPPDARSAGIPAPLSAVVMKLLAKSAEDRYQTAAGLAADLRRCLMEWESTGTIDPFTPGAHDASDRLLVPETLYGRDRDINALTAAFEQVVTHGTPGLALVSGYAGIGKSSVVHELHKALVPSRGLFAAGKFDQYQRDIPYVTIAQAFHTLIRQILGASEAELRGWREALLTALEPNGQLIVNLIPALEFIIGPQPPVPDLPASEAKHRFQTVFQCFLSAFARPEHPLVLFLDDLQWLDAATLDLVSHLVTEAKVRHLLLVGAYRDNEVGPSHPLTRTLETIRRADARVCEIVLGRLALDDVERLVSDALHCERERAAPLAQLVHQKTDGNPFFAIQFLTVLADEGLLAFDATAAVWTWDFARIQAKGYTDNVVDLMVGKLNRLPTSTLEAVKALACLGRADLATLSIVHDASKEEMGTALWEAVRAGLVFRSDDAHSFLHDRVQEAAYSLIPAGERAAAHLRIARLLAAQIPPERYEERSFDIATQFNHAASLIDSRTERELVARLNLMAGRRARAATAYVSALRYFAAGVALLVEEDWVEHYALTFALEFHTAECEFLTGDLGAADVRLSMLSRRAAPIVDRAAVTCSRVVLYTALDRPDRAIEVGLDFLGALGIDWPAHPTAEALREECARIWQQLGDRPIESLVDLPRMRDPGWQAAMDVLTELITPAVSTDPHLVGLIAGRMTNLSLEYGNTDASSFAYVYLAQVLGSHFGDYRAGFRFGTLALDLVDTRGLDGFKARVYKQFGGHVNLWTQHFRAGRMLVHQAFDVALARGDLTFAAYSRNSMTSMMIACGDPLADVEREAEHGIAFARTVGVGRIIDILMTLRALARTLRGVTPHFGTFDEPDFDEQRFAQRLEEDPRLVLASCWYWIRKLQARVLAGDHPSALDAAAKAHSMLWVTTQNVEAAEYHFYAALARAASCHLLSADERRSHLDALAAHHRQLANWAQRCPENFDNRAMLVAAEIARLDGRELDAERLYEDAIRSAHEHGFVHNEGLANELAARFYAARGFETIALAYLRRARFCYLRWGADGKVRQLEESYRALREPATRDPTATIAESVERLDLGTVIKMSQAISEEMVLEKLIHRLLVMAVEQAGAERGVLLLPDGGGQRVVAEATPGEEGVAVRFVGEPPTPSALPGSILNYVLRTHEIVMLDDASVQNLFSADEYIAKRRMRSILCLPLLKQGSLAGVIYLENTLTSHVFTPARIAVLKLLASQAAISVDNARLYADVQESEDRLRLAIDTIPAMVGAALPDGGADFINQRWQEYTGMSLREGLGDGWAAVIHPDDLQPLVDAWRVVVGTGQPFEHEARTRRADGQYRWFLYRALPLRDEHGTILRWFVSGHDIDDQRRAEERVRQDEREMRLLVDCLPHLVGINSADGRSLYVNRAVLEYVGLTLDECLNSPDARARQFHPEDLDGVRRVVERALSQGTAGEVEARMLRHDGQYRWFLVRYEPVSDDHGRIVRCFATGTDIDDRKRAVERMHEENLALREHVAQASMFEEIVGTSDSLRALLSHVSKVAPTDSTVLITGETGTGKELVARAIHRRSQRAGRAFISINCAVIPSGLIASELFGHEKGAFTGALQRRLGRFELAEGGTIFLDEIGELPHETQVALLRVLQEREFERVGGGRPIRVDVRVIAATNRDLKAAVAAGSFRSDLYYRLNVFPVSVPPLRARRDDIPLLVAYFVERYARNAGKKIQGVSKASLDLLLSYPWPGNVRELQNVIERSVIISDSEMLSVDQRWLLGDAARVVEPRQPLVETLNVQEKTLIEEALAETKGRVSGPSGAAVRLGIRASTLESKIRTLGIDKRAFKTVY